MTAPYWTDGQVTLYLGDCREVTEWLAADVLVTDPPYGVKAQLEYARGGRSGTSPWAYEQIAGDGDTSLRDWALTEWGDRPALMFGSVKRERPHGWRAVLAWDKGLAVGMGDLSIPWKPNWDEIYVLGSGFTGSRDSSVLRHNSVSWTSAGRSHPHEKPLSLMQYLVSKCPPGVVTDPFAGAGSTLVAARNQGRRAVGVEIDERYAEMAARLLAQMVMVG